MIKNIIIILVFIGLVLPNFCLAQEGMFKMPQTIDEAKDLAGELLKALPGAVKKVWQEEAWPFFLKTWDWVKQELQKETAEMKGDLPNVSQSLWQRFKDLLD